MVYAAAVPPDVNNPLPQFTTLAQIFGVIINVVLGVGIALTIIYLILGGIRYIMSQGDPKNTQVAREWLTNAVIGFIVVIGAFVIRTVVISILGATNTVITDVTPEP
ncbi:hypothetical protein A2716_03130 [candidate division WWE3 bacterium RIFCSPHIGHO2_01_FULL_40_23]|nr:MAG: hypothetical protein A2716_03130 [candidate division WWE3 bacterium RIFCSPHIGHO2_01_FULL_40_23]